MKKLLIITTIINSLITFPLVAMNDAEIEGPHTGTGYSQSTPLWSAVARNHISRIKEILASSDTRINEQNYKGETALMLAAEIGNIGIVKILLEAGADPNIADYQGKTVLLRSANNQKIFDLLLDYKRKRRLQKSN